MSFFDFPDMNHDLFFLKDQVLEGAVGVMI